MSLPETIWWCVRHNRQATHRWMNTKAGRWVCDWCASFGVMGQAIEVELHPVGSRVAGPDDLVIRREVWNSGRMFDGIDWHLVLLENGKQGYDETIRAIIGLVERLAAAEGGE